MATVDSSLIAQYEREGFVVVENLLSSAELEAVRRRMADVAEGLVPTFPTSKIEYEPCTNAQRGRATVRKIDQCAENDDVFLAHAANAKILDIVELLIGRDIKLYASQCFMKPPGGIEKPYHQDSAYFPVDDRNLVTCWAALDDATLENGCLWVIPGSHRGALLDHDQPWQVGDRVDMQVRDEQIDRAREVPIELKAGSCSFHHSMLLHRSGANNTQNSRRGLAVHYMTSRCHWVHPTQAPPKYLLLRGQEYEGCV